MKTIQMRGSSLALPAIIQGCMRMAGLEVQAAERLIQTDLELGITMFDHADIYGKGQSHVVFGKVLKQNPGLREKMLIQSKMGIRAGMYDSSREHLERSLEQILRDLGVDYLDMLLIHRPDVLMEPEEIAETLDRMHAAGKVRYFGVSNHTPGMIALLEAFLPHKLLFNQLQFGLMHTSMIDQGVNTNTTFEASADHDGGVLYECWRKGITIQAWSPYQVGFMEDIFIGNPKYPEVNQAIEAVAQGYGVAPEAIPTAFILRHPAQIQTIIGTMRPERVKDIAAAGDIVLTREEWYKLYQAAGNRLP